MKRGVLMAICLLFEIVCFAQTGKEFWFSIPYVDKSHDSDGDNAVSNTTNYFRVSTGEIGAEVTFYKYTGGVQSVLYTTTIGSNSMASVTVGNSGAPNISLASFVIDQQNTILDRGIFISSTAPISIYYEIGSPNNTELFTLKGKDALGTEFYPVLQNAFPNKNDNSGGCAGWALDSWTTLDILASEDNTTVTITRPTAKTDQNDALVSNYDYYKVTRTCSSNSLFKRFSSPANGCTSDDYHIFSETNQLYTQVRYEKRDVTAGGTVVATTYQPKNWIFDTTNVLYSVQSPGTAYVLNVWWSHCTASNPAAAVAVTVPTFESQFSLGYTTMVCSDVAVLDSNRKTYSYGTSTYSGSSVTSVTLNKGNVYSIKAETQNATKLFDGVVISATKPIGVVMKDDGVFDGSCGGDMSADLVGDQIVPSSKAGTVYIIPDFNEKITGAESAQDEYVFIRALADGTQITIVGETSPIVTLNKGEVFRYSNFKQDNTYKLIKSNSKPFECYHLSGLPSNQTSVTEFAGALVPPVDSCTGSTVTAFVRPESTTFRPVLISRTNAAGTFKYFKQGDASWTTFNPTFTSVDVNGDGTADWYYACDANVGLGSPTSGVNYLIKNTDATFHFGFLQKRQTGISHGCFYGYFSDFTAPELLIGFSFKDIGGGKMRVQLNAVGGKEGTYDWDLISPTPASSSCADGYFKVEANCDKTNPITLDSTILALNGAFKYKCTGDNTCKAGKLTNYVTFDVVSSVAKLPIELSTFGAHCVSVGNMLEWLTLSEYKNSSFSVLRSYDGVVFEKAAIIDGQGTKNTKTYYSFIDSAVYAKRMYYKLINTDEDGNKSESKVVSIYCNNDMFGNAYPTLCRKGEMLNIVSNSKLPRIARIITQSGFVILEQRLEMEVYQQTVNLNIPVGAYILQIIDQAEVISQQQIVVW